VYTSPVGSTLPHTVASALARLSADVAYAEAGWMVRGSLAGTTVDTLAGALYQHWYTRPDEGAPSVPDAHPLSRSSLLPALRAAHVHASTRATGWTVTAADPGGTLSAQKNGAHRILRPGEYVMPVRPGVPAAPGEEVHPIAPLEFLDEERELWWSFSDPPPERPLGRIYFNARPATAARVVHLVTVALLGMPYQLKCPTLAAACRRCDAVVLYHERARRGTAIAALAERREELDPLLDPAVPPLTCPVERGISWADDVDEQRSFGESRCRILAAAIDRSAGAWAACTPDARVVLLVHALHEAGVDPEQPWIDVA
jgi:hypothetical protein